MAGQQHVARPLEILADRNRLERMPLPHRAADARADVVERADVQPLHRSEPGELVGRDGDHAWGPGSRERAFGVVAGNRAGVVSRPLAGEGAGNRRICGQRRDQRREPAVGCGQGVLHHQHDEIAGGLLDAEIARQAVIEVLGGDLDHAIGPAVAADPRCRRSTPNRQPRSRRPRRCAALQWRRAAPAAWPRRFVSAALSRCAGDSRVRRGGARRPITGYAAGAGARPRHRWLPTHAHPDRST